MAAVALAIGLGVVDYLTGREWAISAFYLLPTSLAAWVVGPLVGIGRRSVVHVHMVDRRYAQWPSLPALTGSCLECNHAIGILCRCCMAAD